MRAIVYPGCPWGTVRPPCSKSQAHRAIFCASMSGGRSVVSGLDMSEDIEASIDACRALGAGIELLGDRAYIMGAGGTCGGNTAEIDCRQSASTLRFAIPASLALGRETLFMGQGRLMERPLDTYRSMCWENGFGFDLSFMGLRVSGKMESGVYRLGNLASSQFVSGMMMALGSLEGRSELAFGKAPSAPYISMTAGVMESFGQKPALNLEKGHVSVGGGYGSVSISIEADWSQAAVWACLGAVLGRVECIGLDDNSLQGDRSIKDRLEAMGACTAGNVFSSGWLKAAVFDCTDCPDLAPMAAFCGCFSEGVTRLVNVRRLTVKECDRAAVIVEIINRMGGRAEMRGGCIEIYPVRPEGGVRVGCRGDHRMVMMAAALACGARKPVEIEGAEAVGKSYPGFWHDLASLGIRVDLDEKDEKKEK